SRRRHTRSYGDWSSDVCSSDLHGAFHLLASVRIVESEHRLLERQRFRKYGEHVLPARLDQVSQIQFTGREMELTGLLAVHINCRSEERRVGKGVKVHVWWTQYR